MAIKVPPNPSSSNKSIDGDVQVDAFGFLSTIVSVPSALASSLPEGINLTATNHSMEVNISGGGVADWESSFVDMPARTSGSATSNNFSALTTVVPAPGSSVQRIVMHCSLYCITDGIFTVQKDVGGIDIVLLGPLALASGERAEFTGDSGWKVYSADGSEKGSSGSGFTPATGSAPGYLSRRVFVNAASTKIGTTFAGVVCEAAVTLTTAADLGAGNWFLVVCWGGGGAGANGNMANPSNSTGSGGGGGGGARRARIFSRAEAIAQLPIVIAAGLGAAPPARVTTVNTTQASNQGGSANFGTLCSAFGGGGGFLNGGTSSIAGCGGGHGLPGPNGAAAGPLTGGGNNVATASGVGGSGAGASTADGLFAMGGGGAAGGGGQTGGLGVSKAGGVGDEGGGGGGGGGTIGALQTLANSIAGGIGGASSPTLLAISSTGGGGTAGAAGLPGGAGGDGADAASPEWSGAGGGGGGGSPVTSSIGGPGGKGGFPAGGGGAGGSTHGVAGTATAGIGGTGGDCCVMLTAMA